MITQSLIITICLITTVSFLIIFGLILAWRVISRLKKDVELRDEITIKENQNMKELILEVNEKMKELRKQVFASMKKYVDAYLEVKKEVLKTGEFNDDVLHQIQAQINAELNARFDEAEERINGSRKKGLFSR